MFKYFLEFFLIFVLSAINFCAAGEFDGNLSRSPIELREFPFDLIRGHIDSRKLVFAHYMTTFPLTLDNKDYSKDYYTVNYLSPDGEHGKHRKYGGYLRDRPLIFNVDNSDDWQLRNFIREMKLAKKAGIDGFAVDILGYGESDKHWMALTKILTAAEIVDFKIMLMPDMVVFKDRPHLLYEMVKHVSKFKSAFVFDGKLIVAPFSAQSISSDWWQDFIQFHKQKNEPINLLPVFLGWQKYIDTYKESIFGVGDWGCRSYFCNQEYKDNFGRDVHKMDLLAMQTVSPQDFRPHSLMYFEAGNTKNYRYMWESAISGDSDWVQIVTWNDYAENSHVAPSLKTGCVYYDLSAYYIYSFKNGRPPDIKKDALYVSFRTNMASNSLFRQFFEKDQYRNAYKSDVNKVEIISFATKPAKINVVIGGVGFSYSVPAGMSIKYFDNKPGSIDIKLLRSNATVVKIDSREKISQDENGMDLLYHGNDSSAQCLGDIND